MPINEQIELARMADGFNAFLGSLANNYTTREAAIFAIEEMIKFDNRFPVERKEAVITKPLDDPSLDAYLQTMCGRIQILELYVKEQEQSMKNMGFTPSPKEFWVHQKFAGGEYLLHQGACAENLCSHHCKPFQLFPNPCVWKDPRKELPKDNRLYLLQWADNSFGLSRGIVMKDFKNVKLWLDYPHPPQ